MNLYQITTDIQERMDALQARLDDGDSPTADDDEVQAILGLIDGDLTDKLASYRHVMLNLDAQASAYEAEIDRLTKRKKAIDNSLERLKNAVFLAIKTSGQNKFEFETGKMWVQASAPSVRLDISPEHLPEEYQKHTITADTTAIKKALQADVQIDGAVLVQGEHLRIK
ncbi:siphovirus Gp157 family protein [Moraxella nasibovis]|uniref:siphovirus Gp157 family protein n=1 Tax=Moraxella nasibovis TaxID=2904120 RepID=UPI00240F746C|nr:siphovirus Gp157 family protein [Moraxella nasibovis]WFF39254.1 siphovirus Gp157 family protein [Moraxella nasibovis]